MKILGRNFPFFSKAVKWVCRPSQVIGDDGKSIEDKLEEIGTNGGDSGSGGSGMLRLSLCGSGVVEDGAVQYSIIEDELVTSSSDDIILKSQTDAILAAPAGTIIAMMTAENNDGNICDIQLEGFGFKSSDSNTDNSIIVYSNEYVESIGIAHEEGLCTLYLKDESESEGESEGEGGPK